MKKPSFKNLLGILAALVLLLVGGGTALNGQPATPPDAAPAISDTVRSAAITEPHAIAD